MSDRAYFGLTVEDLPFGVEPPVGMPATAVAESRYDGIPSRLDTMATHDGYPQRDVEATEMAAASPFQGGQTRSPATS
jgi:hypothetical protein